METRTHVPEKALCSSMTESERDERHIQQHGIKGGGRQHKGNTKRSSKAVTTATALLGRYAGGRGMKYPVNVKELHLPTPSSRTHRLLKLPTPPSHTPSASPPRKRNTPKVQKVSACPVVCTYGTD